MTCSLLLFTVYSLSTANLLCTVLYPGDPHAEYAAVCTHREFRPQPALEGPRVCMRTCVRVYSCACLRAIGCELHKSMDEYIFVVSTSLKVLCVSCSFLTVVAKICL